MPSLMKMVRTMRAACRALSGVVGGVVGLVYCALVVPAVAAYDVCRGRGARGGAPRSASRGGGGAGVHARCDFWDALTAALAAGASVWHTIATTMQFVGLLLLVFWYAVAVVYDFLVVLFATTGTRVHGDAAQAAVAAETGYFRSRPRAATATQLDAVDRATEPLVSRAGSPGGETVSFGLAYTSDPALRRPTLCGSQRLLWAAQGLRRLLTPAWFAWFAAPRAHLAAGMSAMYVELARAQSRERRALAGVLAGLPDDTIAAIERLREFDGDDREPDARRIVDRYEAYVRKPGAFSGVHAAHVPQRLLWAAVLSLWFIGLLTVGLSTLAWWLDSWRVEAEDAWSEANAQIALRVPLTSYLTPRQRAVFVISGACAAVRACVRIVCNAVCVWRLMRCGARALLLLVLRLLLLL